MWPKRGQVYGQSMQRVANRAACACAARALCVMSCPCYSLPVRTAVHAMRMRVLCGLCAAWAAMGLIWWLWGIYKIQLVHQANAKIILTKSSPFQPLHKTLQAKIHKQIEFKSQYPNPHLI